VGYSIREVQPRRLKGALEGTRHWLPRNTLPVFSVFVPRSIEDHPLKPLSYSNEQLIFVGGLINRPADIALGQSSSHYDGFFLVLVAMALGNGPPR